MKLIIDIPEDSYERVMNPDKFYRDIDGEKIRWAVYKGTPIPDNATVCDIEQIRAEIEQLTSRYSISNERGGTGQVEWSDRLIKESDVLQIIDKYTK